MDEATKKMIVDIRESKSAGINAVSKLIAPEKTFSYKASVVDNADYLLEAKVIANIIIAKCKTYQADIAKKIKHDEIISSKEVFAVASYFTEMIFTFGELKQANAHIFTEEKSAFEKEMDARFEANS